MHIIKIAPTLKERTIFLGTELFENYLAPAALHKTISELCPSIYYRKELVEIQALFSCPYFAYNSLLF